MDEQLANLSEEDYASEEEKEKKNEKEKEKMKTEEPEAESENDDPTGTFTNIDVVEVTLVWKFLIKQNIQCLAVAILWFPFLS